MSRASEYADAVSRLYAQQGEIQANAEANKGKIWGSTISTLGQVIPQQIQEGLKQRAAEREEKKLRDLFSAGIPSPGQIIGAVGPERGIKIINGLAALKIDPTATWEKKQAALKNAMLGLNALSPEMRKSVYPSVRQRMIDAQVIHDADAPPELDEAWWQQTINFGKELETAKGLVPIPGPDGKPVYGTPQAGAPVYEKPAGGGGLVPVPGPDGKPIYGTPAAGAPVYEKAGAGAAPILGSFEDYVMRTYGANPTSQEIVKARQVWARSDDAPGGGGSHSWVLRDGKPLRVSESQIRPGDKPYSADRNTGDTAQDRQRNARTQAARGFLARLNELRTKINTKMGPEAGLTGMARRAKAGVGWDPDVAEYERERAAGGRALAVAIMGAQNLSDADAKAWADMLPGATVDKETAQRLMTQIETMLDEMNAENPQATATQPAAAPAPKKNPFR